MRNRLTLLCTLIVTAPLLGVGVAGCGDPNAGALFADVQYASRCEETLGCAGPQFRDICGIHQSDPCIDDGRGSPTLSCTITEAEASRVLNFSATQGDFSFAIQQAVFSTSGGPAGGGSCRVRITEGDNTYEGMCGSSTPSDGQPCQINNVQFYENEGNAEIMGDVFCEGLENRANPILAIEVTAPGNGPSFEMMPGTFRIANCDGLTL